MRTSNIGAFKLTHVAAAYYKGDEKGPQLQRIYGTAFKNKTAMDEYFKMIEEAKRRDHSQRRIPFPSRAFPVLPESRAFGNHNASPGPTYSVSSANSPISAPILRWSRPLGLLDHLEILVHRGLVLERRAVDALELRAFFVAPCNTRRPRA